MEASDFLIVLLIFAFLSFLTTEKINDLNNRIEELEKQSEEVHEYILNRIGG